MTTKFIVLFIKYYTMIKAKNDYNKGFYFIKLHNQKLGLCLYINYYADGQQINN